VVWEANGVLNLAPRLTDPARADPGGQTLPGWISDIRIEALRAEIAQGRYRDLEEGHDLAVEDATVRLSPLPILDKGQVVVDTPDLLMRHVIAGEARAQSFAIDDIRLEGLELEAKNDHGTVAIKHLSLALAEDGRRARDASGGTVKGIGVSAQGKLHFISRPPAEQSSPSSWRELAGIDLSDATANFDELVSWQWPGSPRIRGHALRDPCATAR